MDLIIISAVIVVFIAILLTVFLRKSKPSDVDGDVQEAVQPEGRPVRRPRDAAVPPGAGRRRGARQRLAAGRRRDDSEEEDEVEDEDAIVIDRYTDTGKKIGAKKMMKLQEKEERRRMREAEALDREERKKQDELRSEQKRKEEAQDEAMEAAKEEEERLRKEEEERREHEEYLKMKEAFTVEEEGQEVDPDQDVASVLQEFIDYIKDMKVVMLEDLASHFKLKTQDAIDRVKDLQEEGRLSGVMDDRGKFIYITQDEYEAVAKFIRQRGRVSITELAESSNQLINMAPDNMEVYERKLLGETGAVAEAAAATS